MSIIKGIKNIEAVLDKAKIESSGAKVNWLKLDDGESAQIRFVSELDADSPNYDEKRGLAIVISEHTNPEDYKRNKTINKEDEDILNELSKILDNFSKDKYTKDNL